MLYPANHIDKIHIEVVLRCYAELNDFLKYAQKFKSFPLKIKTPVIVSEVISTIGVPLSEVDLILVNSVPVQLNHKLAQGDYISVYPVFESFDISGLKKTNKKPLRKTKFIADAHLCKLSKYLRMLGFDTLYQNDFGDEEIINISLKDKRIILTRDKRMLNSKRITHGYFVRAIDKHKQLIEIVDKFDLKSQFHPFSRCMECNSILISKAPDQVKHLISNDILVRYKEFYYCNKCHKVFWKGSHFERMKSQILNIIGKDNN
ncbi:Mut7-C RNAse domain-containing protein [Plebeiibacterium sediminum]|uniref:Mut7-C ubiquitin/RNAse domain-containing protein n=1 Tax=Plebeiibacterium sediminum TaxID=2992112 RepID=A0AAE3M421_9BACT|nr:Mut7-C RNAse domain-containing protein [Plebeiobacterium sediminum]MCW3786459.1 Mut7-C ubiquitin/RNAse domain-containing protein [Plebeiobacterium sediminum]